MGVLTMEIEKVNKTIVDNQKEVEKLQRQLERAKEKKENQKQYEKDLHIAIENDLKNCFYNCFEREGLEKGLINLSLKITRDEVIQNVGENEFERNFIDNNYERVLSKVKKVYENDQKAKNIIIAYKLQQQQEQQRRETEQEQEQEQTKQEKSNKRWNTFEAICHILGNILKWTCLILFGGIYLIFKFMSDLSKGR